MEHLENHPHALVKNGIVKNLLNFDGHDYTLLEQVRQAQEADEIICCCDNGIAFIGGQWIDGKFRHVPKYDYWIWDGTDWVPPVAKPEGNNWFWNDSTRSWEQVN